MANITFLCFNTIFCIQFEVKNFFCKQFIVWLCLGVMKQLFTRIAECISFWARALYKSRIR